MLPDSQLDAAAWNKIGIDPQVLLFTLGLAMITGLLFGLAPAYSRVARRSERRAEGRRARIVRQRRRHSKDAGGRGDRDRAGAADRRGAADAQLPGAARRSTQGSILVTSLSMTVSVAGRPEYVGAARENLYKAMLERVEAVPGVRQASMTNHLPIAGDIWGTLAHCRGPADFRNAARNGRHISRDAAELFRDHARAPSSLAGISTIMTTETRRRSRSSMRRSPDACFRRRSAGKANTLGDPRDHPKWMTIVGVVNDVKQESWSEPRHRRSAYSVPAERRFFSSGTGPHARR